MKAGWIMKVRGREAHVKGLEGITMGTMVKFHNIATNEFILGFVEKRRGWRFIVLLERGERWSGEFFRAYMFNLDFPPDDGTEDWWFFIGQPLLDGKHQIYFIEYLKKMYERYNINSARAHIKFLYYANVDILKRVYSVMYPGVLINLGRIFSIDTKEARVEGLLNAKEGDIVMIHHEYEEEIDFGYVSAVKGEYVTFLRSRLLGNELTTKGSIVWNTNDLPEAMNRESFKEWTREEYDDYLKELEVKCKYTVPVADRDKIFNRYRLKESIFGYMRFMGSWCGSTTMMSFISNLQWINLHGNEPAWPIKKRVSKKKDQ